LGFQELEDMISIVQNGVDKTGERLRREQTQLRFTDSNYIRAKLDMVKRHAEEMLNSVLKNDSVTVENLAVSFSFCF
jgi:galactokinase/mevalonate kinase-like predicted kinase